MKKPLNMITTAILATALILNYYPIWAQNKNVHCPDTVKINSYITTYGFSYADIDTVKVKLYPKNNHFKQATDSFFVYATADIVNEAEGQKRFINVGATHPISNTDDWEVILANGKYVFKISDVKVEMQVVRHSLYICQLHSYRLNGVEHTASDISFSKPDHQKVIPHN
jgi:hypothetical protein